MENKKEIKKLLEGADVCLIATDKGTGVIGSTPEVLGLLVTAIKAVRECKGVRDEEIEKAFELSTKSVEEVEKEAKDMLKKFLEKLFD